MSSKQKDKGKSMIPLLNQWKFRKVRIKAVFLWKYFIFFINILWKMSQISQKCQKCWQILKQAIQNSFFHTGNGRSSQAHCIVGYSVLCIYCMYRFSVYFMHTENVYNLLRIQSILYRLFFLAAILYGTLIIIQMEK